VHLDFIFIAHTRNMEYLIPAVYVYFVHRIILLTNVWSCSLCLDHFAGESESVVYAFFCETEKNGKEGV